MNEATRHERCAMLLLDFHQPKPRLVFNVMCVFFYISLTTISLRMITLVKVTSSIMDNVKKVEVLGGTHHKVEVPPTPNYQAVV